MMMITNAVLAVTFSIFVVHCIQSRNSMRLKAATVHSCSWRVLLDCHIHWQAKQENIHGVKPLMTVKQMQHLTHAVWHHQTVHAKEQCKSLVRS